MKIVHADPGETSDHYLSRLDSLFNENKNIPYEGNYCGVTFWFGTVEKGKPAIKPGEAYGKAHSQQFLRDWYRRDHKVELSKVKVAFVERFVKDFIVQNRGRIIPPEQLLCFLFNISKLAYNLDLKDIGSAKAIISELLKGQGYKMPRSKDDTFAEVEIPGAYLASVESSSSKVMRYSGDKIRYIIESILYLMQESDLSSQNWSKCIADFETSQGSSTVLNTKEWTAWKGIYDEARLAAEQELTRIMEKSEEKSEEKPSTTSGVGIQSRTSTQPRSNGMSLEELRRIMAEADKIIYGTKKDGEK